MRAQSGNCEADVDLYLLAKVAKKAKKNKQSIEAFVADSIQRFIEPGKPTRRSSSTRS